MKNEIIETDIIDIEKMIYEIDGKEVMLDSDLAILYGCKNGTKEINQAVRNNPDKFPKRYSFVLSNEERKNLWSKFLTANISTKSRSNPRVFTEQGIYMLATILKSKEATKVSIRIMDTFVKMRHYINFNKVLLPHRVMLLEEKVDKDSKRIDQLFDKFNPKDIAKDFLFFKDDLYDAYSTLLGILNRSNEEIIIIDNYANKDLLDILRKINRKIIIVSKNIDDVLIKKYESQYKNVTFIKNNSFHDRFIILDRNRMYSCGSSLKDVGKKCFAINEFEDSYFIKDILKNINIYK